MYEELKALTSLMQEALSRCEHCGKEGSVYDCDECQETKVQFTSIMTDLVNGLEPNGERRMAMMLDALAPILDNSPQLR